MLLIEGQGYPLKTIVIANISEFYFPTFGKFHKSEIKKAWINPSWAESDMAINWAGNDKLVILPKMPDSNFIYDLFDIAKFNNVHIACPSINCGPSICQDIENDPLLFDHLVFAIKQSDCPEIISWGATEPLYNLLNKLKISGAKFHTPEIPSMQNYWVVPYLDSKVGFREFCREISKEVPEIKKPSGYLCTNMEMASSIIESRVFEKSGFVIKSNEGVGGYGTLIYPPGRVNHIDGFSKKLQASAKIMPIFAETPIVVEEYIEANSHILKSSPSIQGVVLPEGKVKILALAGQIVSSSGQYLGTVISPDLFPNSLVKRLHYIGLIIGNAAAKLGYRGVFGIDTILGKDNDIYSIEMNARRTSVRYLLDLIRNLFGSANSKSILSSERFVLKGFDQPSYADVLQLLSEYLFPMHGKARGMIVTISSSLQYYSRSPQIGFVVIDDDLSGAQALYSEIVDLLGAETSILSVGC